MRQPANGAVKYLTGYNRKTSNTDDAWKSQAGRRKLGILAADDFVKPRQSLVKAS